MNVTHRSHTCHPPAVATAFSLGIMYAPLVLLSHRVLPPTTIICLCLQVGQCFTVLSRPPGSLASGKIGNVLKFRVKEIDPSTGEAEEEGYEDEYQVCRRSHAAVLAIDVAYSSQHEHVLCVGSPGDASWHATDASTWLQRARCHHSSHHTLRRGGTPDSIQNCDLLC